MNCPPVRKNTLDEIFEMAIIDSPRLDGIKTDLFTFREKFRGNDLAVSFENLGGDAVMVCPMPLKDEDPAIYSSMGQFIRGGHMKQQVAFWGDVGKGMSSLLSKRTVWLNTAGGKVHFVHMRMDSRPKHYHYKKFSNKDYYKN